MPKPKSDKPKSEKHASSSWHVPVARDDIAETGRHVDLTADRDIRSAVARLAGLRDLPRFEASFDVARHGGNGLRVTGRVSATVGQTCVVTLEPLVNEVEEELDLKFAPQAPPVTIREPGDEPEERIEKNWSGKAANAPEPLIGGTVDLGALAIEFLILGLDPYPRKPGAVFEQPQDAKPDPGPFAALAQLTKGRNER